MSETVQFTNEDANPHPLYERAIPEVHLWLKVINEGQRAARGEFTESLNTGKTEQERVRRRAQIIRDAQAWIEGEGLELVCKLLGLNVEAVRRGTYA